MELNTLMDVDLVAVESEDEVTVMLELTAPASGRRRAARAGGGPGRAGPQRLDGRRTAGSGVRALAALVERLDPADRLGVVAFDDEVEVVIPAGPVLDKAAARAAVLRIAPRRQDEPVRRPAARASGGAAARRGRRRDAPAAQRRAREHRRHERRPASRGRRGACAAARRDDVDGRDRARLRRDVARGHRPRRPGHARVRRGRRRRRHRAGRRGRRVCSRRRCRPRASSSARRRRCRR